MPNDRPVRGVLLDFNGTLFFDTPFHMEAWTKVYMELRGEEEQTPEDDFFRGPRNDALIQVIAPQMTKEERKACSIRKEAVYREICRKNPEQVHLAPGAEELFAAIKNQGIPFTLATASILDNMNFYFEMFPLNRWFEREQCVYDDGNYENKGAMHLEAARRLGVPFQKCLVVEDSTKSIRQAKENGAGKVIGIGGKETHPGLLRAGADDCICDFREFDLRWLE